jgi:hypothetical protein
LAVDGDDVECLYVDGGAERFDVRDSDGVVRECGIEGGYESWVDAAGGEPCSNVGGGGESWAGEEF